MREPSNPYKDVAQLFWKVGVIWTLVVVLALVTIDPAFELPLSYPVRLARSAGLTLMVAGVVLEFFWKPLENVVERSVEAIR